MPPRPDRRPKDPADSANPLAAATSQRDCRVVAMVERAIRRQDVLLAFQPVISPHHPEQPAFYEGLMRILDETGRVIPASQFIGAVENTDTGRMIDCLALDMGLYSLARDRTLRLSVNMSARSIGYPRWLATLDAGLRADPTLGQRLILEITESSAMLMPETIISFMADMQDRGITFALDDFGAGFTSFRYLREFLFDMVKIDGQFITGIADNPDNQVLAEALLTIARHFEMFIVAEAVESARDAEYLTRIGIDGMQGYYYGAATIVPPWDVGALSERRRA
jgi:EAL domain-containing protein (putative c-di-GMP-specific phosphodiesterase class I)